jgi:hypothetical protein
MPRSASINRFGATARRRVFPFLAAGKGAGVAVSNREFLNSLGSETSADKTRCPTHDAYFPFPPLDGTSRSSLPPTTAGR